MDNNKITEATHNEFKKNHEALLDYIHLTIAENPLYNLSKLEEDLEYGLTYLHSASIGSSFLIGYDAFKKIDVFSKHLAYSRKIGKPLKNVGSLIRCTELACLYLLSKRIPKSKFESEVDDEYVATPFFDFKNKWFPAVYRSTISAILASGESAAEFYLKILTFNLPEFGTTNLVAAIDEDWIKRVSAHQAMVLNEIIYFDGVMKRRSFGALLDLTEIVFRNRNLLERERLSRELAVLYGNYLASEFSGEWAKLDDKWVVIINQKVLCDPFIALESAVKYNDSDILFKDLLRTDNLVSKDK